MKLRETKWLAKELMKDWSCFFRKEKRQVKRLFFFLVHVHSLPTESPGWFVSWVPQWERAYFCSSVCVVSGTLLKSCIATFSWVCGAVPHAEENSNLRLLYVTRQEESQTVRITVLMMQKDSDKRITRSLPALPSFPLDHCSYSTVSH